MERRKKEAEEECRCRGRMRRQGRNAGGNEERGGTLKGLFQLLQQQVVATLGFVELRFQPGILPVAKQNR